MRLLILISIISLYRLFAVPAACHAAGRQAGGRVPADWAIYSSSPFAFQLAQNESCYANFSLIRLLFICWKRNDYIRKS